MENNQLLSILSPRIARKFDYVDNKEIVFFCDEIIKCTVTVQYIVSASVKIILIRIFGLSSKDRCIVCNAFSPTSANFSMFGLSQMSSQKHMDSINSCVSVNIGY